MQDMQEQKNVLSRPQKLDIYSALPKEYYFRVEPGILTNDIQIYDSGCRSLTGLSKFMVIRSTHA